MYLHTRRPLQCVNTVEVSQIISRLGILRPCTQSMEVTSLIGYRYQFPGPSVPCYPPSLLTPSIPVCPNRLCLPFPLFFGRRDTVVTELGIVVSDGWVWVWVEVRDGVPEDGESKRGTPVERSTSTHSREWSGRFRSWEGWPWGGWG